MNIKQQIRKRVLAPLLMVGMSLMPIAAKAECSSCWWSGYMTACVECATVFEQLTTLINQTTDLINQNIDMTRDSLTQEIRDATSSIVAAIEKQSGAEKELKQAELNYDAAAAAKKAAAEADDMFTSPLSDIQDPNSPTNACATAATAEAATSAATNARVTARALAAADVRQRLYTSNAAGVMREVLTTHNQNFCSVEDQRRGRCATVAPAHMQDANLNAGTLLAPAGGDTYSEDESKAAKDYVRQVLGPVPTEVLPIAVEKTPAGQRFLVEQRSAQSIQSMAAYSLNSIFAAHSAEDSSSTYAGAKVSVVGLMKKFVEERFGTGKYSDSLVGLNEVGLLKQVAINLAFQNWMDYHTYLQGERTEALLATTLAMNARERSERDLEVLRRQALATK